MARDWLDVDGATLIFSQITQTMIGNRNPLFFFVAFAFFFILFALIKHWKRQTINAQKGSTALSWQCIP